jgi:hypothetical protein
MLSWGQMHDFVYPGHAVLSRTPETGGSKNNLSVLTDTVVVFISFVVRKNAKEIYRCRYFAL